MNYEEFKQEIIANIKNHLSEKYANADVSINEVVKNNETLDGLIIRDNSVNVTPTIYLESFYDDFKNGTDMDEILDKIAHVYEANVMNQDFDVSSITNLENVRDKIIPRVVGIENNELLLNQRPHEVVAEDLAILYVVNLGDGPDGNMSVPITMQLMEQYGLNQKGLHDIAMENMEEKMHITFKGMNEVMAEMMLPQLMESTNGDIEAAKEMLENMMPPEDMMYVLSNEEKLNGAVAVFDQKTMDDIAEKVGGDFFVLPSSTHEVIVVPMGDNAPDRSNLEDMVHEVNETQVAPQDRLSNSVYAYDSKSHELMRADKYEERLQEREEILADKPKEKMSFKSQISEAKQEANLKNTDHKDKNVPSKKKSVGIED